MLGLVCGTLYLYSLYGPQLAARLGYTATQLLLLALLGNLGVAVAGPVAGATVDRSGYTVSISAGAFCVIGGYVGLRQQYEAAYENVLFSAALLFVIGCGLTFINQALLKCCATCFPRMRGVATALPLAFYGLSAMLHSLVASVFFSDNTAGFLGYLLVSSLVIFLLCGPSVMLCDTGRRTVKVENLTLALLEKKKPKVKEAMGWQLLNKKSFWALFIGLGAFSAVGQMYIYNVGYMTRALLPQDTVHTEQQLQVALLSAANFAGRLAAGVLGDVVGQRFSSSRSRLLFVPGLGLVLTQMLIGSLKHAETLRLTSLLTGFFYGFTYCIVPLLVGDAFGMEHFSGNWGLVGLAPILPSLYLTGLFGKVYDMRADESHVCVGRDCYRPAFDFTLVVASLACGVIQLLID